MAQAKVFILTKDDHDRDHWKGPVHVLEGHWDPSVALRHFLEDGDDHPEGTYRCASSGGAAVLGWDGERLVW